MTPLERAAEFERAGRLGDAAECLRAAARAAPGDARTWSFLGRVLLRLGQWQRSGGSVRGRAAARSETTPRAWRTTASRSPRWARSSVRSTRTRERSRSTRITRSRTTTSATRCASCGASTTRSRATRAPCACGPTGRRRTPTSGSRSRRSEASTTRSPRTAARSPSAPTTRSRTTGPGSRCRRAGTSRAPRRTSTARSSSPPTSRRRARTARSSRCCTATSSAAGPSTSGGCACPATPSRGRRRRAGTAARSTGGRSLLRAEQGLGDTLQLVRFAPVLAARGARVVVETQACDRAHRADVSRRSRRSSRAAHRSRRTISRRRSRACRSGSGSRSIPFRGRCLTSPPTRRSPRTPSGGSRRDGAFTVGIAWQGNPVFPQDCHRSMPLRHFAPLAAIPGVRLFSLQKGFGAEQLAAAPVPGRGPRRSARRFGRRVHRHGGRDDGARSRHRQRFGGRPRRRRARPAGVGRAPARARLALAARPRGHAVVPDDAPLPPAPAGRVGRGVRADRGRARRRRDRQCSRIPAGSCRDPGSCRLHRSNSAAVNGRPTYRPWA